MRRVLGIAAGVLFLILAAVLVRNCLDARQEQGLETYVQETSSLAAESSQQSEALFEVLEDPGDLTAVDVQNTLNAFSLDAQRLVEQARGVDPPGDLLEAHERVVLALELRTAGLEGLAAQLPSALGDEQRGEAIEAMASDMRSFLASDVILSERAVPRIREALEAEELGDEVELPESEFLPGIEWLQPKTVREAIGAIESESAAAEAASPGLHGTGLAAVVVQPSGTALAQGTATEVPAGEGLAFEVEVENQGENDESDVTVSLALRGGGARLGVEGTIEQIAAGGSETVALELDEAPPTGEELEAVIRVEPVPGEENADNNEATYGVVFTEQ